MSMPYEGRWSVIKIIDWTGRWSADTAPGAGELFQLYDNHDPREWQAFLSALAAKGLTVRHDDREPGMMWGEVVLQ